MALSAYISYGGQRVMKVVAGKGGHIPFSIHVDRLEEQSATFVQRARKGIEDEEAAKTADTILCPDVEPKTLEIVSNWLYTQTFAKPITDTSSVGPEDPEEEVSVAKKDEKDNVDVKTPVEELGAERSVSPAAAPGDNVLTPPADFDERKESMTPARATPIDPTFASRLDYADLLEVYIFATKYDFPQLKMEAMKQWQRIAHPREIPSKELTIRAYEKLPVESPLLCMIAWQYASHRSRSTSRARLQDDFKGMPPELVVDMLHFDKAKAGSIPEWCAFHEHESVAQKQACADAHNLEITMREVRKRKNIIEDNDNMHARLKEQKKLVKKLRTSSGRKTLAQLDYDDDGWVIGTKN